MSFSVGIRLSVSSSQYLMSISCALPEAYAAMSAASASSASVYGLASMSSAAAEGNSFTAGLSGLSAGTTYYYQAYVKVQGTGDKSSSVSTFYGITKSFTTSSLNTWLSNYEMPATTVASLNASNVLYAGL